MILAYALPPVWLMLAAVYLLIAVPTVFIASVMTFALNPKSSGRDTGSRAFTLTLLGLSLLNLSLTFYFFFWLGDPRSHVALGDLALLDFAWIASVTCSPILLSASVWRHFIAGPTGQVHR